MDKIKANIILEILGRPVSNVIEALNTLIKKLSEEKGVKITEKKVHPPVEVKDAKDLYTTFAEISLDLDSLGNYFGVLFGYMPSHIELVYPERITLRNDDVNHLANLIAQRLHNYDAVAKKMIFERDILAQKLKEVAPELFKQMTEEPKKPEVKVKKGKKKKKSKKK